MGNHLENITELLKKNNFTLIDQIKELPSSGSNRIYYRVYFKDETQDSILASFNSDVSENIAHFSFTMHFRNKGLNVPEIYAKDSSYRYFLIQDLGNDNMLDKLKTLKEDQKLDIYKKVIDHLIKFQTKGIVGLDLDAAYPVKEFGLENIMWDLNYFKYYFIKPHNISFNELLLENDFVTFADFLLEAKSEFFLYRDFQARNIMLVDGEPWFIDFQGGRKGPLQYDLVSLLYQAKANLGNQLRDELLEYYLEVLSKTSTEDTADFRKYNNAFVYFRTMQVMGAYGFRGKLERKGHFLQSIPFVIRNLKELIEKHPLKIAIPELQSVFKQISKINDYDQRLTETNKLLISINSFSYKKAGIPIDTSGNGGGFIFDCRSLPNPGRYKELKDFTGLQKPVIDFLKEKKEMDNFLANCFNLSKDSITNYLERGFGNLQINFGCTGGKHRSVYSAEWMSRKLKDCFKDKISIDLRHLQIEKGI